LSRGGGNVFGIVLREKEGSDGLNKDDVIELLDLLGSEEAYPIEISAKEHESSAMGFITTDVVNGLEFDYEKSGLNDFIAEILDDVEKESNEHCYEFKGIKIWLDR